MELLLRKNEGRFKGWLSYTLSKSEQLTQGRTPLESGINNGEWYSTPFDKTHDISFTASYELNDRWTFGSNFLYQTGLPTTFPNGQYQFNGISIPTFESRNSSRLPAYHRLDISATFNPRKNANRRWKAQWVFGIYNLYNRRNAASIQFGENDLIIIVSPLFFVVSLKKTGGLDIED